MRSQPPFGYVRRGPALPEGTVFFESGVYIVNENSGDLLVSRDGTSGAVSVDWSTPGAGSSPPASGTLNWADGDDDDKPISIGNLTAFVSVTVTLSDPVGTGIGLDEATITYVNI